MSGIAITKVYCYSETFDADMTNDPALVAAKNQIFKDFRAYLLSGGHMSEQPISRFGRDELYDHPNTSSFVKRACLRHVHIVPISVIDRVRRKYDAKSDIHLVYCIDDEKGHACAIALIKPGHELARDSQFLANLAAIAEKFYDR